MQETKTIEYDCECESCKGTGLYVGFAEQEGAAVVCQSCNGTGQLHEKFNYKVFVGKKQKRGIKRVFECNPGIIVGTKKGELELSDFGGMPYEDWEKGKKFPKGHEMRKYTCPAWYYQTADSSKKPKWKECISFGSFKDCPQFTNKNKCWKKFDRGIKK